VNYEERQKEVLFMCPECHEENTRADQEGIRIMDALICKHCQCWISLRDRTNILKHGSTYKEEDNGK